MIDQILIAIDGPAGSGKSTIAKLLAKKLRINYLDTGAMYRAVAYYLKMKGYSPSEDLSEELEKLKIDYKDGDLYINGIKVGEEIRSPEVGKLASDFAKIQTVRERLTKIQRTICEKGSFVVDGRDIGTVVLPHADVKIFLTASFEERVKRRLKELQEKGIQATYEQVAQEMMQRDEQDSSRSIAPLKPAQDAFIIDTTGKTVEEVLNQICEIISRRVKCEYSGC
ncbi:(d)CMP kinase [Pseudothermotoga thermarum]|uniref:Cytidylate kinase n=1 Tax=Pseudothermotoga thermarum DSM 5069 TaxID=688269 RepID=F7YVB1_9THEM|nr:cytidylate kinase [Pseudothermotoga thermarum DSM 5069]